MRYLSICSGIEAATVAWHPLGWEPAAFSEIEAFPRAVLQHHYPAVPLHGDFTTIGADEYGPIDLLVGGTPCQSFSIAGLRGGLADDRGNLALEFLRLAQRTRAKWLVWENVPGVLSSNGGRDFGAILGGMVELGYGLAYRVLDAQHFGVPQRRRRVFVVGYLGDWRRAAAVLFERHSLQGNPAPRREAGQGTAVGVIKGAAIGRQPENGPQYGDAIADGTCYTLNCTEVHAVADTLTATYGEQSGQDMMANGFLQLAHSLRGEGFDASEDGTGRGTPLVPVQSFNWQSGGDARGLELRDNVSALTKEQTPAICLGGTAETMYGVSHADASQTHPDQALRALRDAVGEKAYSEWCAGILAAFRTPEVLRSKVHGRSVRWARDDWHKLVDDALSCPEDGPAWPMLALWQAGCVGRSPRGWQPPEQLARELVAHMSELPRQRAQAARFLLGLWRTSEGLGLLREALSALQEAWRPPENEGQSARLTSAVRRLTPREAERLQGFPDDYTLIPWRGKPASECPDGPRYKALGNSMAVPVMAWIGQRIDAVESAAQSTRAAA